MDLKGSSFESMSAVLKKIGELINPFGRNVTTPATILSAKQRFYCERHSAGSVLVRTNDVFGVHMRIHTNIFS